MEKFMINDMKRGWYIGNFSPSALVTKQFEVCYTTHKKGELWEKHYHKVATEITLVIRGTMKINDTIYKQGDIIVIHPNEVADSSFIEDTELVIVKTPSDVNDKYVIPR